MYHYRYPETDVVGCSACNENNKYVFEQAIEQAFRRGYAAGRREARRFRFHNFRREGMPQTFEEDFSELFSNVVRVAKSLEADVLASLKQSLRERISQMPKPRNP